MNNKLIAITYGTYDLFHIGHLNLFMNIKKFAHKLIVGVSTDEFSIEKGKKTICSFEERLKIVSSIKYVDDVFQENSWDQKSSDIKKYGANLFVMGDDWIGNFDYLNELCDVIYLPRTNDISTTIIKNIIFDNTLKK